MPLVNIKHNHFRLLMVALNVLLIVFLLYISADATYRICDNFLARSFVQDTKLILLSPFERALIGFLLLTLLVLNIVFREILNKKNKNAVYVLCALDILIGMAIIYTLNFAHKGILFLTFANILFYVDQKTLKYILCFVTIVAFILFDYNILSYFFNVVSLDQLISYYDQPQQFTVYTIKSILSSINEILLFLFMIVMVQEQVDETTVIHALYTQLNSTVQQLTYANAELENYAKLSEETAKIKERNRLAREIHDTVGHTLTGISVGLDASLTLLDLNPAMAKAYISKIQVMSREGLLEVRRSVHELKVDAIEKYTLVPALEKLAADIRTLTKLDVRLSIEGDSSQLAGNEEEAIYRIVQESTTNVVKHSNATEINIRILFKNYEVEMEVLDNGTGSKSFVKGFGITHMEERMLALNGEVIFIGRNEVGFCVAVLMPLKMRSIV